MSSKLSILLLLLLLIIQDCASEECVHVDNCTLTLNDPEIIQRSCKGYTLPECRCDQERNVNFVLYCECCHNGSVPMRNKRNVPVEAMFGLKTYTIPVKNVEAVEMTPKMLPLVEFQTRRLADNTCGDWEYGDVEKLAPALTIGESELKSVIIRSTHATTAKNCWNLCRYNILSGDKPCTAVGFIELNSQKPLNDCLILSESPVESPTPNITSAVAIFEICI